METKFPAPVLSFIDLLMDAVFAVDADARVAFASPACERIFGYTPQEMVGKNMFDLMAPEDRERTRQSVVEVMSGNPQLHFENRYIRKDGHIVHIMWSARWSEADQMRIGVARDITARKRAESMQAMLYAISEAAYAAEDLLTLFQRIHKIVGEVLPVNNFSVVLYDKDTDQLSFPYHVDEIEPKRAPSLLAGTLCAEIIRTGQPVLLTPDTVLDRLDTLRLAPGIRPLCWLGVPLKSHTDTIGVLVVKSYPGGICYSEKDQELLQFVSTQIATVIERQQMQLRLQHMAQYDQLTGLPNRSCLYDRLDVALAAAQREEGRLSLLYVDLDKFKQVNDTHGHHIGDVLLQEVSLRLKLCLRKSDTVARIGGDEFVVLLHPAVSPQHAGLVAEKICSALKQPFVIEGHSLDMILSIGIAHYPEHGDNVAQLLKHADKAMYLAKNSERHALSMTGQNAPGDGAHVASPA